MNDRMESSEEGNVAKSGLTLDRVNPHYLCWNGTTQVLITSGEHYGAVVNAEFDYQTYLRELYRSGLNYTRVFSGAYIEPVGAFNISRNTLAPLPGEFLPPWLQVESDGHGERGTRFDLDRWNADYFRRLDNFISEAASYQIIVELTLFSSIYTEKQWLVNPFNPLNNINQLPPIDFQKLHTLENGPFLSYQEKMVGTLVTRLNKHPNLFFEIQNEPWADNPETVASISPYQPDIFPNIVQVGNNDSLRWQTAIAQLIQDEERLLPRKHLIAQNIGNFKLPFRPEDVSPGVSIAHFHYAEPEAVLWNLNQRMAIGCDETGFAGSSDSVYWRQAWQYLLSGGAIFNHLDYSFTVGHEDGSDNQPESPGGGSRKLRNQLGVLKEFLGRFDLSKFRPSVERIKASPGVVPMALTSADECAIYFQGRGPAIIQLELGPGNWTAEWVNVITGEVLRVTHFMQGTQLARLESPDFKDEVALALRRNPA